MAGNTGKVLSLEGADGQGVGSQASLFPILRVECLLVVGCGYIEYCI